jgi:hypothetical protein
MIATTKSSLNERISVYHPLGYNGWEEYLMAQRRKSSQNWVAKAVKSGRLPRASNCECVDCGRVAAVYDHRDYRSPHLVDPVCKQCDSKRGHGSPRHYSEMFSSTEIAKIKAEKISRDSRQRVRQIAQSVPKA